MLYDAFGFFWPWSAVRCFFLASTGVRAAKSHSACAGLVAVLRSLEQCNLLTSGCLGSFGLLPGFVQGFLSLLCSENIWEVFRGL